MLDSLGKVWRANQTSPKRTCGLRSWRTKGSSCSWKLQLEFRVHLTGELRELAKLDLVVSRSFKSEPDHFWVNLVGSSGLRLASFVPTSRTGTRAPETWSITG